MSEFDKWIKMVENNHNGKNICFISRGEWADPQIAYDGKLLNYCGVEGIAMEGRDCDYEPTDEEWLCACMDSLFGYTECDVELDDFTERDAMSVYSVIKIK